MDMLEVILLIAVGVLSIIILLANQTMSAKNGTIAAKDKIILTYREETATLHKHMSKLEETVEEYKALIKEQTNLIGQLKARLGEGSEPNWEDEVYFNEHMRAR